MRKRRLALGIVATSILVCSGAALAAAEPEGPLRLSGKVADLAESEVVVPSPATHGVGIAEFADEVRAKAQKVLGERFVEMWMTKAQDELVVGVTGLESTEVKKLERAISTDVKVSVEARNVSRKALDQAYEEVHDLLPKNTPTTISRLYERGTIGVSASKGVADAVARAIVKETDIELVEGTDANRLNKPFADAAQSSSPRVTVTAESPVTPTSNAANNLPYESGKRIVGSIAQCSLAFTVDGGGGRYSLTAGHCGPNNAAFKLGNNAAYKSKLQNNAYWGNIATTDADAAVLPAAGPSQPTVFVAPQHMRTVVAQSHAVSGSASAVPYMWVCESGASTTEDGGLERCGYIVSTDVTMVLPGPDGYTKAVTDMFSTTWTSGPMGRAGDSGSGVYGVNPDGTAIALGILSACNRPVGSYLCDQGGQAYYTKVGTALARTGTTLAAGGRPPFGSFDVAQNANGSIYLAGWAIDPDLARNPVQVHVYVGGPAGSGAPGFQLTANGYRPDVGLAYPNTGHEHGFHGSLPSSPGQSVPVYVYAIDMGAVYSGNVFLGVRYVNVS